MPRKTAVLYSLCLCIAVCLFLSLGCTAPGAESLGSVSEPDENGFRTCVYKDVKRKFLLYIPENASKGAPLLFMLHGYGDAADVFADTTGMAAAANARGYAVVYPQGQGDPSDKTSAACWNFDGKKDGNDDVGFLTALARYLQSTYGFDKKATFVTGFSNGAFMTYRLAGDAPKTFRAVASVSGTMGMTTWKERMGKAGAAILQITGTKDDLVALRAEDAHGLPAVEEVIAYWKAANVLGDAETEQLSPQASLSRYGSAKRGNLLWNIVIENGRHAWPQEAFSGVVVNEVILDFFDAVRGAK